MSVDFSYNRISTDNFEALLFFFRHSFVSLFKQIRSFDVLELCTTVLVIESLLQSECYRINIFLANYLILCLELFDEPFTPEWDTLLTSVDDLVLYLRLLSFLQFLKLFFEFLYILKLMLFFIDIFNILELPFIREFHWVFGLASVLDYLLNLLHECLIFHTDHLFSFHLLTLLCVSCTAELHLIYYLSLWVFNFLWSSSASFLLL